MGAAAMSKLKPYLDAQGVQLIGLGTELDGYDDFVAGKFFTGTLYLDESKKVYKALGCTQVGCCDGCWGIFQPRSEVQRMKARADKLGYASNLSGDYSLMGGTFGLAAGGAERYAHYQSPASMEPDHVALCRKMGVALPDGYQPFEGIEEM
jgi:hypothetical protein